jgi:hypothetical protein
MAELPSPSPCADVIRASFLAVEKDPRVKPGGGGLREVLKVN